MAKYSDEFRREAIRLVDQGSSVREVAEDLGVNQWTLRGWIKQSRPSEPKGAPATLEEENRRLREENKRLKVEREILKRATAFFASEKP